MKLLIDIGNSRIKCSGLQAGRLALMHAAAYTAGGVGDWCEAHLADWPRPQAVLVANVAGPDVAAALSNWCRSHWDLPPWFARSEARAGGVSNGYRDRGQLGVDRWLALIAARRITPGPVCVVSCGTAVTLDAMNAAGEHLGGMIVPGPELMRAALNTATPGAHTTRPLPVGLALGRSTETGVAGGVTCAVVGLIERAIADLRAQMADDIQCLITGGDATILAPLCRVPLRVIDDLVLRGLAWYAEER